jgi:hypothetical protein
MFQFLFNIFFSLLLLIGSLAGCDRVQSKFDQINLGMNRSEAVKILGEPQKTETKTLGTWTGELLRWRIGEHTIVLQINEDKFSGKQLAGAAVKARVEFPLLPPWILYEQ